MRHVGSQSGTQAGSRHIALVLGVVLQFLGGLEIVGASPM